MKKLTFKTQFVICMGFLIFSFVLANITKQGIFTNIEGTTVLTFPKSVEPPAGITSLLIFSTSRSSKLS